MGSPRAVETDALGEETAAGGQVARVELEQQDDDGEDRDRDLPVRDHVVDPAERAHREEVDRGEQRHQDDRDDEAEPCDVALHRVVDVNAGPVQPVLAVLQDRETIDRRDRYSLEPGEETERDASDAAEREVRESRRASRQRVHPDKLGMDQREDDNGDASQDPRQQRRAADRLCGEERAEEPAGPNDRCLRRPHRADQPQLASEAYIRWRGSRDGRIRCHVEPSFRFHYKKLTPASRPHGNDHQGQ